MKDFLERRDDLESIFTDREFLFLKDVFEKRNPGLSSSLERIRGLMTKFKKRIYRLLEGRLTGFGSAIIVLVYGLNFLARYVGEKEFMVPDLKMVKDKHCAVFIPVGKGSPLFHSIAKIFSTPVESGYQYRIYADIPSLLNSIIRGEVCGVMALHFNERFSIENCLKYQLDRFGYRLSEDFPFCLDFLLPCNHFEIIDLMVLIQGGMYGSVESLKSLECVIPRISIQKEEEIMFIDNYLVIL